MPWIFGVIVAFWALGSVFYQVEAESEGVVLRLGKHLKTSPPGLHAKLPWPIDSVTNVPVRRIQTLEFGFATVEAGRVSQFRTTSEDEDVARMLTGDLNLAIVEWIVQYQIKDAYSYLYHIGGDPHSGLTPVDDTIRDVSESVMRRLVGNASVDEVITIGRDQIASRARGEIQKTLDDFESGVDVITVKLQAATPPNEVKDAFDEVNRAKQSKERVVNEALGQKNSVIPAARGQRDRFISEAQGYREKVVLEMRGRANAFLAQLTEFEKAPEVTRARLYLETMEEVLAGVESKTVIDESIRGVLPLLNLDAAPSGSPGTARPASPAQSRTGISTSPGTKGGRS
jgi:membrane protease subunit HflK